jgi:hypothetical protein
LFGVGRNRRSVLVLVFVLAVAPKKSERNKEIAIAGVENSAEFGGEKILLQSFAFDGHHVKEKIRFCHVPGCLAIEEK